MTTRPFSFRPMVRIVCTLGWADFIQKYRGSVLGYLWSFAVPITRFLVIYFVFQPLVGADIPSYPLYLFLGVILWEYFSSMTSACLALPFEKAFIIQHVRFPRILLLFVAAWANLLIFCTHIIVFLALAVWFDRSILENMPYVPVFILQMTLLALGVGGMLSAFVLRFRDLQHLWNVVLTVLFWLTPIMYRFRIEAPTLQEFLHLPEKFDPFTFHALFAAFVRFQPLSVLLFDARRALLYGAAPSLLHAGGFTVFCTLVAAAGAIVFHRRSRSFLEEY